MTQEERAYNYASKKNPSKFTVGEIAKHYGDGYADGYKDAVDKACEWLRRTQPQVILPDTTIERFKKYMEEQQ